jgi:transposase
LRRCQILLSSADGKKSAYKIASELGCDSQTVRNVIHKFNRDGLQAALRKGSRRPHTTPHKAFDEHRAEALRAMLHHSPRNFGKDSSLWTLQMAAQASFEKGLTQRQVSGETIRATLARMGVRWQLSPNAGSPLPTRSMKEKRLRDRLIELAIANADTWAIGYQDECWWSRVALPALHSFSAAGEPLRLVEQSVAKDDPDPKAISCYGLYVPQLQQTWRYALWRGDR